MPVAYAAFGQAGTDKQVTDGFEASKKENSFPLSLHSSPLQLSFMQIFLFHHRYVWIQSFSERFNFKNDVFIYLCGASINSGTNWICKCRYHGGKSELRKLKTKHRISALSKTWGLRHLKWVLNQFLWWLKCQLVFGQVTPSRSSRKEEKAWG